MAQMEHAVGRSTEKMRVSKRKGSLKMRKAAAVSQPLRQHLHVLIP